jgi:uncharacterized damage-inducible protein DinB
MEDDLRYPMGQFHWEGPATAADRAVAVEDIADFPARLKAALTGLSDEQIDTPYRPGGWTVRQLVHHLADSHLNAYARLRLGLTESEPSIKTWEEKDWAELPDARSAPVDASVVLLQGLHERWDLLLRAMSDADFERNLRHPDRGLMSLDLLTRLYGWHGRHHVAHITALRRRMGW